MSKQRFQIVVVAAIITWVVLTLVLFQVILQYQNRDVISPSNASNHDQYLSHVADFPVNQLIADERGGITSIGVLMIASNRTQYLKRSFQQLIDIRAETINRFAERYGTPLNESKQLLPIMISLDCDYRSTLTQVLNMAAPNQSGVRHIFLHPDAMKPVPNLNKKERKLEGYYRIARHYRWAMNEAFQKNADLQMLIIVEDDLIFSPDFLEYFLSLAPLLEFDHSLMCISAWNDNGKEWMINSSAQSMLYRTDFFPGLGWMLQRSVWEKELWEKWPPAFWDDWLRHWERMRNRTCIRPEVPRTSTIGKKGVSKGQFFNTHLQHIRHSTGYVPFFENRNQIWYELSADNYTRVFHEKVYQGSQEIHPYQLKYIKESNGKVNYYRMTYFTHREFEKISAMFGLMSDFKYGVPRTAFLGVVSFVYRGHRVFLAPPVTRKAYIKQWM